MGELLTWVSGNWVVVVGTMGTIVMGASIMVRAVAPFTATKKDDEVAGFLDKVHAYLSKLAINPPLK